VKNRPAEKAVILLTLAAFHMAVSGVMSLIARSGYFASYHNGRGLWNFGMDSFQYNLNAGEIVEFIQAGQYHRWLALGEPAHVKLISFTYWIFSPDPYSFEPVNALVWVMSIALVYHTAHLVCSGHGRVPVLAGVVYGFWPSNLLLSTQLLKDPFYNLGVTLVFAGWTGLLCGKRGSLHILAPVAGIAIASGIREGAWPLLGLVSAIALILLVIRGKTAHAMALWLTLLAPFAPAIAFVGGAYANETAHANANPNGFEDKISETKRRIYEIEGIEHTPQLDKRLDNWLAKAPWGDFNDRRAVLVRLAKTHGDRLGRFIDRFNTRWEYSSWIPDFIERRIFEANKYRDSFLTYYISPRSNTMDKDILFRNGADIILYLPRALQIVFFAPFPNQWFGEGAQGGGAIRKIAGMEMAVLYSLWVGFAFFILRSTVTCNVKIWMIAFLFILSAPIGLFVPNLGTLYRMRLVYMLPVMIGGVEGWRLISAMITKIPLSDTSGDEG